MPNRLAKPLADAQRVRFLAATFRNILLVVFLIFAFAAMLTVILWAVCDTGMKTANTLKNQGLPALRQMASLQENLALYRLYSYGYLFVQEAQKAGAAKAADDLVPQMHAELKNMQQLFPEGRGRLLAFNVEKDVDDLAAQFRKVRVLVDSDFAAAMKSMDQDIPPKIRQVEADADALKEFGYQYSGAQASATFASFGSIKHTAVIFGIANSVIAFCAFMFVLLAARRSRGQLSETLARLDERTQELQQTNGALETEVDKYQRTEKMLRESEERFSSAFELAPIGMALVAPEGRWLKVNRAICELVGYAEAELLAHTFQEITHPADLAADLDCVRRLLAGEIRFYQMEKRYIHARGHFVTVLLDVSLVHDTQGQPLYFIAQIQDITERKRAASALLESQRFLRATLDALTSHIAILDERGTIIEVNAAWNRFAGENNFPASDDVGNNYLKVCDSAADNFSKEAPTVGDGIRAVIAGQQKEFQLEYPCHSPHEKGWFLVRVTRFGGDGPVRVVVAHENITERKQAEEDLRWKTAFLEAQVNSSIDGILVVDPQSRKLLQNQRFNDLFKLPRHIVDDQDDEKQFRWIKDMMKNSEQFVEKVVYLYASPDKISRDEIEMKDGTILDRYSSPVTGKDGRHYGRIWTFRDITDRKKLESQLIQSQKMETVGKLAGGVAHEFNSILTAIIMQSELLLADLPADSPLAENATEITKAANRAATLTRQLLAYGRKQFLQPKTLDLNLLVTEMEDTLRHLLGRDVDVRVSVAGFKMVLVDAGQIEQVIMNLAMNARDAMPKGGKLTLETAEVSFDAESVGRSPELKPGEYVMLAMTDNGTGMSAEVKTRLFEPFFTTKDIGQGTGLGLSTCYGIIKQSGGHISVYSELGRGTTFKIYLPQVETPAKLPVPQLEAPDLPRGTETILLVEDDPALREMAAMLLRRLGYTVLAKANGIEALSLETQRAGGRVDLLLTDVVMPHMSGRELADRVRALYPHTKILFTSAYTENAIVHQDTLDKGVALLQKPFTPSALANKLRAVLDAPAA